MINQQFGSTTLKTKQGNENNRVKKLWKTSWVYPAPENISQRLLSRRISMASFCINKDRKGVSLVLAKSVLKNDIHPVGSYQHRILT